MIEHPASLESNCVLEFLEKPAWADIHKAKGKEFNRVVLVEGAFKSAFFDDREKPPHQQSRRLLRVGLTRVRTLVTIVRPNGAHSLVG